jgi:hypothetical protein
MRKTLLSLTAIAALAMPGVAQARHGADDPAGHVRHAAHQTAKSAHPSRHRHRHHHRRADDNTRARGTDDNGGRRGGGADDGPNHR